MSLSTYNQKKLPSFRKNNSAKMLLHWEAEKFEDLDRHPHWHFIVFIVLLLFLLYAIFSNNYLFGIIVILSGFLIYVFEKMPAKRFSFGISTQGVLADDVLHKFSSLKSFWIFYEPTKDGRKELSLEKKGFALTNLHIPLNDMDPDQVREILLQFIPEMNHPESIIDSLEKYL